MLIDRTGLIIKNFLFFCAGIYFSGTFLLTPESRVCYKSLHLKGAVAQLGERLNGIQEVRGSIPRSSTKNIKGLADQVS